MLRKLLASTALVAVMATGAYAETKTNPNDGNTVFSTEAPSAPMAGENGYFTSSESQVLATTLIGKPVYNGTGENAENVGDVNDIVMSPNGTAEAIVVGVGGFLGLGEKNVAIDFENVSWLDRNGETWLVVAASKEQLESAPEYKAPMDKAETGAEFNKKDQDTASAEGDMTGQNDTVKEEVADLKAPAMTREDVEKTDPNRPEAMTFADSGLSAEELIGTTVYGAKDEAIGKIGDVIVDKNDKVEAFVIEVGGFLGFGEKPVAVAPARLSIMKNENGELAVHTDFTESQLKDQLAFTKKAWDTDRESVLVQ
ncbi:MAG: PRC-barrel domain-containing protein [Novosphingobium sp.]|nr:PRC-barrel domain-containing protein [Novosphingobium sp.]